jgi:3'-phosphoadenosine 5'-phosphosulfate sulfotransferase (PAPS reductase)/FAD synthetase
MIADKIAEAWQIYEHAVDLATRDGHKLAAVVALFSGGHDSTIATHLFRHVATHAGHANTSIGIEQTRQYVRDTCKTWELPLIEKFCEPGRTYRDLVLGDCRTKSGKVVWSGFPGPGGHGVMYARLKERGLDAIRSDLIGNPRKERLIFITGLRQTESRRRANREPVTRDGSAVFCNPITSWTKLDQNDYRKLCGDVPSNEVSDLLHMSGECLCGAFAHEGELEEIGEWFPDVANEIRQLEKEAESRGIKRCKWGWGTNKEKPSELGPLCNSCEGRYEQLTLPVETAAA